MKTTKFSFFHSFFRLKYSKLQKNIAALLVISYFFFGNAYTQCPSTFVQVGSSVGIPNLASAISANLLTTSGGTVVSNFCVTGEFTIDGSKHFNCDIHINSGSKLIKNGTGITINNSTITGNSGSQILMVGTGPVGTPTTVSLPYILFNNCTISNITKMKAENRSNYSFGGGSLTDVGLVEGFNDGRIASFGTTFLRSPIKIDNNGFFFDDGSSILEAIVNSTSYNVQVSNGARFFGGNNSNYKNAGNGSIICDNCGPSYVEGATITGPSLGRGVLIENATSSFLIDNCKFAGPMIYGVKTSNSSNVTINNCSNINFGYGYLYSHFGTSHSVTNNNFSSFYGADIQFGTGARFHNNPGLGPLKVNGHDDINVISNTNMNRIEYFDVSNAKVSKNNIFRTDEDESMITKYDCNYIDLGMDFKGEPFTEIRENFILGDEILMDCSFNEQVNHGNKFSNGTQLRGGPSYGDGTFFVLNTPAEFPPHTPTKIMNNNGSTSTTCTQGITPGGSNSEWYCNPTNIAYLKNLITKLLKCRVESTAYKGVCQNNMAKAKKLLKLCPKLLDDVAFKTLINARIPQDYQTLPDIFEVMQKINGTQYGTSPNNIRDRVGELSNETISNIMLISSWTDEDNIESEQKKALRLAKINQILEECNNVQSSEPFIINYKNALVWYLEYNRDLYASASRKLQIKALAENCDEYQSPSQKLAVALCKHFDIAFTEGECNELRQAKTKENELPKLYPNPVKNILKIDNAHGMDVEIFSIEGNLMYKENKLITKEIDVTNLPNGVYILNISDSIRQSTLKFIKMD